MWRCCCGLWDGSFFLRFGAGGRGGGGKGGSWEFELMVKRRVFRKELILAVLDRCTWASYFLSP